LASSSAPSFALRTNSQPASMLTMLYASIINSQLDEALAGVGADRHTPLRPCFTHTRAMNVSRRRQFNLITISFDTTMSPLFCRLHLPTASRSSYISATVSFCSKPSRPTRFHVEASYSCSRRCLQTQAHSVTGRRKQLSADS